MLVRSLRSGVHCRELDTHVCSGQQIGESARGGEGAIEPVLRGLKVARCVRRKPTRAHQLQEVLGVGRQCGRNDRSGIKQRGKLHGRIGRRRPTTPRVRRAALLERGHLRELALCDLALAIVQFHAHDLFVQLLHERPLPELQAHVRCRDEVDNSGIGSVGALKPCVRHEVITSIIEGVAELREPSMQPLTCLIVGQAAMPRP
mmetsp:Transcript_8653/g.22600  ORF Transcript_8653/g.22600 Transcript_8653/m.22600 type:complete len:203 (-) Transcript_8653:180-788(-)